MWCASNSKKSIFVVSYLDALNGDFAVSLRVVCSNDRSCVKVSAANAFETDDTIRQNE